MEDEVANHMQRREDEWKRLIQEVNQFRLFQRALIWLITQLYPSGARGEFCRLVFGDKQSDMVGCCLMLCLPDDDLADWQRFLNLELQDGWVYLAERGGHVYVCPTRRGDEAVAKLRLSMPETFTGSWLGLLDDCQRYYSDQLEQFA